MSETGNDLADDIISEEPQHIQLRRSDFQAWHKIRKQYIRDYQWNKTILRYARDLEHLQTMPISSSNSTFGVAADAGLDQGYPLRCLMIPGDDLLDLRSLHKQLEPKGYRMKYLGFNSGHGSNQAGTRVHIANNQVTALRGVSRSSQVVHDSFQAIGRKESMAHQYFSNHGPFHVVNLDICDSLFPNTASKYDDYYAAVLRLAEYQMKHQTTSWLLFITTQVEPNMVDREGLSRLCRPVRTNCDTHPDFFAQVSEVLPATAFQCADASIDLAQLSAEHMADVFGIAFGKWLLQMVTVPNSGWTVTMLSGYKYMIKEDIRAEMLSLGFMFSKHTAPPADTAGMSSIQIPADSPPSELEKALHVINMVKKFRDVDELLRNDAELHNAMEAASADLMESVGFNRAEYLSWARTQESEALQRE